MESFTNLERGPGGDPREYRLDRMEFLAEAFNNPHRDYRVIHVAGSKGKGSTSFYLARALKEKGLVCGLYTSPHIHSYKERITLAGEELPDEIFLSHFQKIENFILGKTLPGGGAPTTFELLTLLAFLIFRDANCQWVVLETGLGGRLDATNIVTPDASVITPIELEHTEFLGDTLEQIAREKAGIIKIGRPVFCGLLKEIPAKVVEEKAREKAAPVHFLSREARVETEIIGGNGEKELVTKVVWHDDSRPDYKPDDRWTLRMQGLHQGANAALAVLVLRTLFAEKGGFPDTAIVKALETAGLPGRMEKFCHKGQTWILDGAHTPDSLALTVESFLSLQGREGILIFGSVLGKPVEALAEKAVPFFKNIIISRAGNFKPEDPKKVFASFQQKAQELPESGANSRPNIFIAEEPAKAFTVAEIMASSNDPVNPPEHPENPRPVLVTGSFYMLDEIRNLLCGEKPC